jgi:hypothetical protein
MYCDEALPGGGGEGGPWCRACRQEIRSGESVVRLAFSHDPTGARDLTGPYHAACSKPFASLAHAMTALSRFGQ